MKIPTITENERRAAPVVAVILAAAFLVYQTVGLYAAIQRPPGHAVRTASAQTFQGEPWKAIDVLLANRERYVQALGTTGIPEWAEFTPEYFADLRERRDRVIAWSAARASPPQIVFVGVVHYAPGLDGRTYQEIVQAQPILFGRAWNESFEASVVSIEMQGSDDLLTPSEYRRALSRNYSVCLNGMHCAMDRRPPTLYELEQSPWLYVRVPLEFGHVPVRCGEEWPMSLGQRLYAISSDPSSVGGAVSELWDMLVRVRSEIMLIRTLEYLAATGGTRGVILQGDAHRRHVEELVPMYHLAFRGVPYSL